MKRYGTTPDDEDARPISPEEREDWLRSTERDRSEEYRRSREFDRGQWAWDNRLPGDW